MNENRTRDKRKTRQFWFGVRFVLSPSSRSEKICETHNSRLERRLNLLGDQLLPVDVPREERMVLDIRRSVDSQPMSWIPVEQTDEKRPSFGPNLLGEPKRILEDLAVHLVGVLVVEGRETGELRRLRRNEGKSQFGTQG